MSSLSIASAFKTTSKLALASVIAACISLSGCGSASSDATEQPPSIEESAANETDGSVPQTDGDPQPGGDSQTGGEEGDNSISNGTETDADPQAETNSPGKRISADAFRMAAYEGRLNTVRQAVAAGAKIDARDATQSLTALHMAAYNGHTETVEFLIENGAEVDARDRNGMTPLIHASTGNFPETVRVLIDAGAEVNAKETTESFTALMFAAAEGQQEVLQVLLENGADKSIADDDQDKAIDHARDKGHTKIVEMLQ